MTTPLTEPSTEAEQFTTFESAIYDPATEKWPMNFTGRHRRDDPSSTRKEAIEDLMVPILGCADSADAAFTVLEELHRNGRAVIPWNGWVCEIYEVTIRITMDRKLG